MHINAHWRIKRVFDNLVTFVYKLGKYWQARAWDPVFKTAGSAPDAAMILGLFSRFFYPALFTLLYFIILVVAISF
jgi:hypothetical protein